MATLFTFISLTLFMFLFLSLPVELWSCGKPTLHVLQLSLRQCGMCQSLTYLCPYRVRLPLSPQDSWRLDWLTAVWQDKVDKAFSAEAGERTHNCAAMLKWKKASGFKAWMVVYCRWVVHLKPCYIHLLIVLPSFIIIYLVISALCCLLPLKLMVSSLQLCPNRVFSCLTSRPSPELLLEHYCRCV